MLPRRWVNTTSRLIFGLPLLSLHFCHFMIAGQEKNRRVDRYALGHAQSPAIPAPKPQRHAKCALYSGCLYARYAPPQPYFESFHSHCGIFSHGLIRHADEASMPGHIRRRFLDMTKITLISTSRAGNISAGPFTAPARYHANFL